MKHEKITIENKQELVGFLRTIGTECRFVTVETETVVEMPQGKKTGRKIPSPKTGKPIDEKTPNPYLGTVKIARRNGFVNADFATAVEKRYADQHGLAASEVDYTPGTTWYQHCQTEDGKPLCLCEHQKDTTRKYMQLFPLRNLGETVYIHATLGKLTPEQIKDMHRNWVPVDTKAEYKPRVITLEIDSIRSITFRKVQMKNDTTSRLVGRLAQWKKVHVSTQLPLVEAETV